MLLERTIHQLDIGFVPPERAEKLGHLGYIQWLGALPGDESYVVAARNALKQAEPFADVSPAIEVFCGLLAASLADPIGPLALRAPGLRRRGGAKARRLSL